MSLLVGDFKLVARERVVNNFLRVSCKLQKNSVNVLHPLCNLQCFSVVIVASCKKNCLVLMPFTCTCPRDIDA